jgi:hypothetical protein
VIVVASTSAKSTYLLPPRGEGSILVQRSQLPGGLFVRPDRSYGGSVVGICFSWWQWDFSRDGPFRSWRPSVVAWSIWCGRGVTISHNSPCYFGRWAMISFRCCFILCATPSISCGDSLVWNA